jgi:Carboxypeptidase regulatory-like domain
MMRRLQFASLIAFVTLVSVCAHGASPGSVSGIVRDSSGVPQIGAVVQLLRPDQSVITVVYTSSKGAYTFSDVLPGRYSVKAMGTSYLPSLRENVRVRSNTVVNLTLNTLYEVMQWLPAQPRTADESKDDWAWTLRSAANRPLLRWLEDGPLVVVSDRDGARPRLKARLMATGQEGTFGESGERFSATVEDTPSGSRELIARVDFAPDTDGRMESMLGLRRDLGMAGSVQSMAAISVHPEIETANGSGLDEAALQSSQVINLGDEFHIEAGAQQVFARLVQNSPNTVMAALPFASLAWRGENSTVTYRMASVPASHHEASEVAYYLPQLSLRDGQLALAHGLHQEIGWERSTGDYGLAFLVYTDQVRNPVVEASGDASMAANGVLIDRTTGLVHGAGPDYSSTGVMAAFERRLPGGNHVRVSYANGNALVMPAAARATALAQVFNAARARRTQTYSISLSGTLEGTGTRWRATYRWQPADTVTAVAPYATEGIEPYLNMHIKQPIHLRHDGMNVEAVLNVRNLLAQGYRPYLLNDGSLLVFAQDQRSIGAGVAFTF